MKELEEKSNKKSSEKSEVFSIGKSQRMKLKIIKDVMYEMKKNSGIINEDTFFKVLEQHNISKNEAVKLITLFLKNNAVSER